MKLSDFDFELPEALIALRPVVPRRSSRLLEVQKGRLQDRTAQDLPSLLRAGDMMVFNNTKVIPARLRGVRRRGGPDGMTEAKIEATLLQRLDAASWLALAKPGKRLRIGDEIYFEDLQAIVEQKAAEGGQVALRFSLSGPDLDAAIADIGSMPLPPYIASRRAADDRDQSDYQSVFAKKSGAVAAPTASLHFDQELLEALRAQGVLSEEVTLHVGAGTFLPVKTDDVSAHKMHFEAGEISADAADRINEARAKGGRVIAVGTTALRLLETAAEDGEVKPWRGETDLFIRPGFKFQIVDLLITNFHLPRSTLLMLVSAFAGTSPIRAAYAHAVAQNYRFYSFGDACLLHREDEIGT